MWCNSQCFLKVLLWDRCFSYYTQEPIIDGLLLYINDLPLGISSTIRLFGNDCSLYRTITGPMDNQILQDYLNALSKWEKDWQMSFNIEKCHTVSFPTKMNIVTPYIILIVIHWIGANHHSYRGIMLSQDLKWANHVAQISSSAKQTLGVIRRTLGVRRILASFANPRLHLGFA